MIREVDRMFQVLVTTMTSTAPDRLTRPFEVADLYQNILPYRLFRRELGLETNQDYELTLTELLSGAGDYLVVEDRMRDVLQRELASPHPDPGAFRQFASSQVSISPDALAQIAQRPELRRAEPSGGTAAVPPPEAAAAMKTGAISAVAPPSAEAPPAPGGRGAITASPGETCRFCGGGLPEGRPITYCPHCGQDQTVLHCDACGTELEVGWKFCTTCGRKVAGG
jgi:hypothetical protein